MGRGRPAGRRKRQTGSGWTLAPLLAALLFLLFTMEGQRAAVAALTVFVAVLMLVPGIWQRRQRRQAYLHSDIQQIDQMSGEDFERYLEAHFHQQGYSVELTPATNDYGADLILHRDGVKTVVQAKRYRDKVGKAAIQEIIGAKAYYTADEAVVITNSHYTKGAIKLAAAADVELWDRQNLIQRFQVT